MSEETPTSGPAPRSGVAMVRMGPMLLIAVFVVFELIAAEYFVANVGLVAAFAVLPSRRSQRRPSTGWAPGS